MEKKREQDLRDRFTWRKLHESSRFDLKLEFILFLVRISAVSGAYLPVVESGKRKRKRNTEREKSDREREWQRERGGRLILHSNKRTSRKIRGNCLSKAFSTLILINALTKWALSWVFFVIYEPTRFNLLYIRVAKTNLMQNFRNFSYFLVAFPLRRCQSNEVYFACILLSLYRL